MCDRRAYARVLDAHLAPATSTPSLVSLLLSVGAWTPPSSGGGEWVTCSDRMLACVSVKPRVAHWSATDPQPAALRAHSQVSNSDLEMDIGKVGLYRPSSTNQPVREAGAWANAPC